MFTNYNSSLVRRHTFSHTVSVFYQSKRTAALSFKRTVG